MWNIINQLRRLFRVSIWKTLFFNFYMLPFSQAIKFPVIITKNVRFYNLSGKVILISSKINPGTVRFGFFGEDTMHWSSQKTLLKIEGTLFLGNKIHFANGIIIRVEKGALLTIENNISISNCTKIICYKNIIIKENSRIAWECQIIDTSFHYIRNIIDKSYGSLNDSIIIGTNNWIGNRVSIMKGSKTPDFCIVASGSLINKKLDVPNYSLVAGTPVHLIRKDVYRVLGKEEKELSKMDK